MNRYRRYGRLVQLYRWTVVLPLAPKPPTLNIPLPGVPTRQNLPLSKMIRDVPVTCLRSSLGKTRPDVLTTVDPLACNKTDLR